MACVCAQAAFEEGYINTADPSVLRFLIASRNEARSKSRSCTALVWRELGDQPGSCPGLLPDLVQTCIHMEEHRACAPCTSCIDLYHQEGFMPLLALRAMLAADAQPGRAR